MSPARPLMFDLGRIRKSGIFGHVEYHRSLPSTNTTARELFVPLLAHAPALVLADEQTAGRGRGMREWWSTAGALTFSLVIRPADIGLSQENCPMLSLATGVAVHDMLAGELTSTAISIKWPNDVYVQHQKICGILSEHVTTDGQSGVIVGVGINVNNSLAHAPDDVRFRATSMFDEQQQSFDLTQILLATTARILHRANELAQDAARIIQPFNQNHLLNGRRVTVNSP
ncbi:MAG: biotin--[acetyl-CoA-carboxylase] ligase, partial [Planctomycetaceae bacterium]|nr:biotin--[acetyl-CoA-carboxylase] ligase [Planctomycetaceae bacterium]